MLIQFLQAGSFRGWDGCYGKLRQIEKLSTQVVDRSGLREVERSGSGEVTEGNDNTCCICYACEVDAQFAPCSHKSCFGCITRHLLNCQRCFFCNAVVQEVFRVNEKIA